jgi:uncharacterized protein (DUF1697 family)
VALLRGINVGGKNKLAMQDLAALFTAAGCREVRTYIQSGNVVFAAEAVRAKRVPGAIARAIRAEFGLEVPVVLRSAVELQRVLGRNPFLGADEDALHVAFLEDAPARGRVATLDPRRSPPDEFTVVGREIYLRCPNGIGKSKLTCAYFDSKLATISTLRNWRTVSRLVELAAGG